MRLISLFFFFFFCIHFKTVKLHASMDQYIRDFEVNTTQTYTINNDNDCSEILKVNQDNFNFKILQMNICSINKNLDEFKIKLKTLNSDVDCVILSETWEISDQRLFNINGYNLIYNESRYNKNDGVAVYIKDSLKYSYKIFPLLNEMKVLEIQLVLGNEQTMLLRAMYRSPNSNETEFLEKFACFLENNENDEFDFCILAGDLNFNLLKPEDSTTAEYINTLNEYGYYSTINEPTRVRGNTKSCLDHIFIRSKHDISEQVIPIVLESHITDHYTTILQVVLGNPRENNKDDKTFKTFIDKNKIDHIFSTISWQPIYAISDPEIATNQFISVITKNLEKCTYKRLVKRRYTKIAPWVTNALLKSINLKNKMAQDVRKKPDNVILKNEYKNLRNRTNNMIVKAKYNYYKDQIENEQNNSKSLWNVVQQISMRKKQKVDIDSLISLDTGELLNDKKKIANQFNVAFVEMGEKLAKSIKCDPTFIPNRISLPNTFVFTPIDTIEVSDTISELKNKKSVGIDDLRAETIKMISDYINEPLTYIFNNCIETGIYPTAFKSSIVTPLHKKGERTKITNYRPISLVTHLSKIFEKIIKKRLSSYLKKYNVLSNSQYGFRANISTEDAILALTSNITKSFNASKPCLCIFIDLSKAFDTVSHQLLLQSLEDVGVRGNCLSLFKSYLADRRQTVRIANVYSDMLSINYGIPQGSVLGPILFNLYINGLFSHKTSGSIIGFADDTAIFYEANSWVELKEKAENDFILIKNWLENRLLTINYEKTSYIPFSCNSFGSPSFNTLNINMGTEALTISREKTVKYLGVIIDEHLKWDRHIYYIVNKLRLILYTFKKLRDILPLPYLKTLYHSLVESHIRYGLLVWGAASKNHIKPLEIMQRRFIKMIYRKNNRYPSDKLYQESLILDIRQLYFFQACIKYHTKQHAEPPVHLYNTRQKHQFVTPLMLKTATQRTYFYMGPKLYNSIPNEIKVNVPSIYGFKNLLKQYLFQKSRSLIIDHFDT